MDDVEQYPIVQASKALRLMRESLRLLHLAGARSAARLLERAIDDLDPPAANGDA
jgi:hypothetical protein